MATVHKMALHIEDQDRLRLPDAKAARSPKTRGSSLKHKTRFPTETVRQSEESLRQLLDDFEQGRLTAFGNSDMLQKMKDIRQMQEKLTVKHFEIDQLKMASDTASGTTVGEEGQDSQLNELTHDLEKLGSTIQSLHSERPTRKPKDSSAKRVSLKADVEGQ